MFSRRGGSKVGRRGSWGRGTTATVKAYRRPPGDRQGAYYVRLGGLFQFKARASAATSRPTSSSTSSPPSAPARDRLPAQRRPRRAPGPRALGVPRPRRRGRARERERRAQPGGRGLRPGLRRRRRAPRRGRARRPRGRGLRRRRLPEGARRGGRRHRRLLRRAGQGPGRRGAGASLAPAGHARRARATARRAARCCPPGSRSPPRPTRPTASPRASCAPARRRGRRARRRTAGPGAHRRGRARARRADAGTLDGRGVTLLYDAVDRAADRAIGPAAAGCSRSARSTRSAEAVLLDGVPDAGPALRRPTRRNPFGRLAGLRISKKNYDRQRAYRFRKGFHRWMPHLTAWDATLRLVAAEARIRRRFKPGFVLDDELIGLTTSTPAGRTSSTCTPTGSSRWSRRTGSGRSPSPRSCTASPSTSSPTSTGGWGAGTTSRSSPPGGPRARDRAPAARRSPCSCSGCSGCR
jgi:hypothetical protein